MILDHEEAHTIKFDWHRPGAQDREPPAELKQAALPPGTVVRAFPAQTLQLFCFSGESIACTEKTSTGWLIRMLDADVAALVKKGRLAPSGEANTFIDAVRASARPLTVAQSAIAAPTALR